MDVANAEGDPTKDPQDATEPQDPVTVAAQDPNDADPSAAVVMDHEVPEFNTDRAAWVIAEQQYGILRLCGIRKAMMPIKKPQEMRHLKLLIVAGLVPAGDDLDDDVAADRPRRQPRDVRQGGKGKGRGGGGRHGPDMGDPKAANPGPHRGAWWRNVSDNTESSSGKASICRLPSSGASRLASTSSRPDPSRPSSAARRRALCGCRSFPAGG